MSRAAIVTALVVPLFAAPVEAQNYRWDLGVNGGYSWHSEMMDEDEAGAFEARFSPGWLLGSQLTFWTSPRLGIRANFAYSDRNLLMNDPPAGRADGEVLHGDVNLWSGSGDLLIRFAQPNESWMGRETLPYLALGVGAKWLNTSGDVQTCNDVEENKTWECVALQPGGGLPTFALGERSVVMGLVGLGADFRMSPRMALRLEVNDRIYKPSVYATQSVAGNQINLASDERATSWQHEVGAQLGLHFLMGLAAPPPVAFVPAPTPTPQPQPPAPAPTPAPAPAPREDPITVCVIDPSATGGIRMQQATFRHTQRDTVVMVSGQSRPLSQAVGTNVMVARTAPWYVQGQPLTLTVGREETRFLPYQSATVIQPSRIVYLGNVNGFPVYADRDEVADVVTSINTARGTRTDAELSQLLVSNTQARNVVQGVSYLYVPMDPYGCTFQPIARQADVRKGKDQ